MKIRTKIILVFLSVTLLALATISTLAYLHAHRVLEQEVLEHLYSVVTIQKNRLEAVTANLQQHLYLVASRLQRHHAFAPLLADPPSAYQEQIRQILQDADAVIPDFQNLAVFTADGRLVTSVVPAHLASSSIDLLRPAKPGSGFRFFLAAHDQLRLALTTPLFQDNQVQDTLLGHLVVEVSATHFLRIVRDYEGLGNSGETMLVQRDAAGNALFLTPLRFDPHAALRRTVSHQAHTVAVTPALQGKEQRWKTMVDYRGVPILAATAYLPAYGWGLVVKMDRAEALAPVSRLRHLLHLLFALTGLAVTAVGAMLAHVLTRPILRLTRAAERIEQGELPQPLEVTSADEIGVLTRTVNHMAAELIAAKATLEQRVQERTAALEREVVERQQAEQRFHLAVEAAPIGIVIVNAAGQIVLVNPEAERLFGYTQAELLGQAVEILVPEHARAIHPMHRARFVHTPHRREPYRCGMSTGLQLSGRRQDGTEFPVEIGLSPMAIGEDVFVISTIQDITERKRAEEALARQRELLQHVFDHIPVLLVIWDTRLQTFSLNRHAETVLGWTTADANEGDFMSKVYPDPAYRAEVAAYMQSLEPGWHEWNSTTKEGGGVPIDWANVYLANTTMIGIGVDLRERKKAEQTLRQSESFYRQTLECIPGMVFTTRPDGYCDYQSQQWVDYTGVPSSEYIGDGWKRLLHPEDQPRALVAWQAALEGLSPYDLEYRVRRHDGIYEWFKVIGRPIRNAAGEIVRWFGVAINIDERKQAEEHITRSLAEKELLLKEIHHRVKNNLQIVSSLLNLQAGTSANPHIKALFRESQNRVKSMALIHETLYRSGTLSALDFQKYVHNLVRYLSDSYRPARHRITLQLDVAPLALGLDTAIPCGLMLTELVSNAFKYAFPDEATGTVRVAARQETSGAYCLSVADDGIGLPPDLDVRRSASLGLQLVANLARQLAAEFAPMPSERGTCFVIRFKEPQHNAQPQAAPEDSLHTG
jgi:PAS domain S-box-containing protein